MEERRHGGRHHVGLPQPARLGVGGETEGPHTEPGGEVRLQKAKAAIWL